MKTQAQQFCEEMSTPEAVASCEVSEQIAAKFTFKVVRFKKHDDKRGLRFADGSKVFFSDKEGTFILPNE